MANHFEPTPEQKRAMELAGSNILVSAAAGSGKTQVLTKRILRMISEGEHPVDIDRLLVVTFTSAAAAEMRERIARSIAEKLSEDPENEHLQRQSTLLHNAQITTIDSFCLFLVRNHFGEIGLDPDFRVADSGEVQLLARDVLAALLEDAFAEGKEEFLRTVEFFCPGSKGEQDLEKHIFALHERAASFPWPEEWLLARKEDYAATTLEELSASDYGKYLTEYVHRLLGGCREAFEEAQALTIEPAGPHMYGPMLDSDVEQLKALEAIEDLEVLSEKVAAVDFMRLSSKGDDTVDPLLKERARKLRDEAKKKYKKVTDLFELPLATALERGRACAEPVGVLIDLAVEFDRRLLAAKQERHIIDFSDMEHYALQILYRREGSTLVASDVAKEYRQYFEEVLIDEYQDSNLVQEVLLAGVSGEADGRFNRFLVGDVKQSIYSFRLARPELFLEKYQSYGEEGDCVRIDLARNFRSRTAVVNTVNDIFERLMSEDNGGVAYDERAALYVGATYPNEEDPAYESEVLLVGEASEGDGSGLLLDAEATGAQTSANQSFLSADLGEDEEEGEVLSQRAMEALAIAKRIKELKKTLLVTEDAAAGTRRAVRYSDIVILLRTMKGWAQEFKSVLEQEGIPTYITSSEGYFAAREVQEILQFLRVLDNPLQDIPLYGVLHSVFGGFTEEELVRIRLLAPKEPLYDALRAAGESSEVSGALREKAGAFLERMDSYRRMTAYLPIRELLQRLISDYGYLDYVTAMPAGERRCANVEMLLVKAGAFEKTSYFGLFHFLRYMDQLEKYELEGGMADMLDENADVVRIVSIHRSKGLEYPVVFVAGLGKRINFMDTSNKLLLDMDLGLAVDYVNPDKRIRSKTLRKQVLALKGKEGILSEELRILYVALTRAKEKLILVGTGKKLPDLWQQRKEQGCEHLSYVDFVSAQTYLDLLMPILSKVRIQEQFVEISTVLLSALSAQVGMADARSKLQNAAAYADAERLSRLKSRFDYVYPYEALLKLYTKTTVSELKIAAMEDADETAFHAFEERELTPYVPAFRRGEEKAGGAERGSAFHRVMELLDFDFLFGEGKAGEVPASFAEYTALLSSMDVMGRLQAFLAREVESLRLSEEYAGLVSPWKIRHFLAQEIAFRMWRAEESGQLFREQPFVLGIDATRLDATLPAGEKVMIQGIIDAFLIEEGQIVLLDYKTDRISSMEELWKRYRTQMDYYSEALAQLMGLPVREQLLYSSYLGEVGAALTPGTSA